MSWRQSVSNRIITVSRSLFASTPIQKFEITTKIYRRVFQLGYGKNEVTADFRGVKLSAPTSDATIVPGLVIGFYESMEIDAFERLAAVSHTILDLGANVGLYSCLAAKASPQAQIIAFEPVPQNLEYIRRNVEQNGFGDRIRVVPKAVGDKTGSLTMHLAEQNIGTHSVSLENTHGSSRSIDVDVVTVDDYLAQNSVQSVDLLKVDVEGFDVAVLKGAQAMLKASKPTLFGEYMPHGMAWAGYSHLDFLDIIFDVYDHVFVLDEMASTIKRCGRADLIETRESYQNTNIIATANGEHARIIESLFHLTPAN